MIGSTPRAMPARTYYGSPVKLGKYGNAGSCGQLWEGLEMVWQRKIGAGISTQAPQPSGVFLGPRSLGREEPQASISFSEIRYPGLGRGGLCVCGYSKGLWDLNEDIKSLLLSLYNSLNK